jgi:hypothetical protein
VRRNNAMLWTVAIFLLRSLAGGFVTFGALSLIGPSSLIGEIATLGLAWLSLGSLFVGRPQEIRHACAQAKKEVYDNLLDAGSQITINGKEWKKGCQVDPGTGEVVAPREELTLRQAGPKPSVSVSLVTGSADAEA